MGTARIAHALIVAGPSGAGKSTFLLELAAGHLPPEMRALLPPGSESWQVICGGQPEQWRPYLTLDGSSPQAGVAIHYDVTLAWMRHKQDYAADPFWRVLQNCGTLTWVEIRPSRSRLIRQWSRAHLGTANLLLAWLQPLRARAIRHMLSAMRSFRLPHDEADRRHWRYPRPLRFLKRIDRKLRPATFAPKHNLLAFYARQANLDMVLSAWDRAAPAIVKMGIDQRIEIAPDLGARIGALPRWRVAFNRATPDGA